MEEPLILERYRPLADLGTGAHGTVVLAFDTRMARRVAIKRLPLGHEARKTGLTEARTAAMLNHPEIVTVYEWDTNEDEAFLVMEHVEGASLADILDQTGTPLDADEAAAVIGGVARALSFAHDNGVLHLDIKPANILITRDGRVKVADFGVSVLTGLSGRAQGVAGTIGYMPPEQMRAEELDARTDEWALASLAFELLTNANPFDSDTFEGSLFKIEHADTPLPSDFEPGLLPGVDTVLLAALAPEAEERYPSVDAFALALLDHLGDAEAGRDSLVELVSGFVEDEEDTVAERYAGLGLWDRLASKAHWFRRLWAAVLCGWLVWAGLSVFALTDTALWGAAGLTALASLLAPGLGLALGIIAFGAALVRNDVLGGILFFVPAVAFWAYLGRRGRGDALAPIMAPTLGVVRAAPSMPLLLGFTFSPLAAALSSAAAALATMAVSAASGATAPFLTVDYRFFIDPWSATVMATNMRTLLVPGALLGVVGWALAAAVCSLACSRGTRGWASIGTGLGAVVLGGAYFAWSVLDPAVALESWAASGGIALMVMVVVIALGAPTRGSE
ncbi:MAG: serine/threonine protein kinase [Coriobacteriia bacterium]|nr:serine/threonine protein kinase [Coriobacteriia bacterium]MBN2823163.1 serine/threonine protein kinase [Coriobacteriia bacterium]